jgi:hypothetical protein
MLNIEHAVLHSIVKASCMCSEKLLTSCSKSSLKEFTVAPVEDGDDLYSIVINGQE